jgi:hypothetical protein
MTIAAICLLALCVLLFLVGVEIGKKMAVTSEGVKPAVLGVTLPALPTQHSTLKPVELPLAHVPVKP